MMETQFEKRKNLICELVDDERYVPMKEKELAAFMQVTPADRETFHEVLRALLEEGKIQLTKQGRYVKPDENRPVGTFIGHAKGFGFVEVEGYEEDFYIPEDKTGGAFHMDRVQIAFLPGRRGQRREAEVVRILERGTKQLVGTYEQSQNFGFVKLPDECTTGSSIMPHKKNPDVFELIRARCNPG